MKSIPASGFRAAAWTAAAGSLCLVLTASKCEQHTTFPGYVAEICNDKIDNDEDGKTDCEDSDCAADCAVHVTINPIASPIATDTLTLTGHQTHATSIAINLAPSGLPGTVTLDPASDNWSAKLTNLSQNAVYNITAIASNGDIRDTATASFTRGN